MDADKSVSANKTLPFSVENILSKNFKRKSVSENIVHPLKSLKENEGIENVSNRKSKYIFINFICCI